MANKWTDMVFCLLDMQPVPKAVLSALAFHSNNDSGQSWPSIRLIGRETGYKETAVKGALKLLEEEGFISKAGTKPAKNGYVNVWQINGLALQRGLDRTGSLEDADGVATRRARGRSTTVDGVATRLRNSSGELDTELVNGNSSGGADDAPQVEAKAGSKPKASVPKIPVKIKVQATPVESESKQPGEARETEITMCSNCGRHPIEDPEGRYPTWCTDCINEQEFGPSKLCPECALDYAMEGQELCFQCRLATLEVSLTDGLEA